MKLKLYTNEVPKSKERNKMAYFMTSLRKGELRVEDGNILLATNPLPPLDMPVCWWSSFNPWLPPPTDPRTLTLSWDIAISIIKSQYSKPTHPPNPITCFTFRAPLDEGAGEGIGRKVVPQGPRETFSSSSSLICGDPIGKYTVYVQTYNSYGVKALKASHCCRYNVCRFWSDEG